MSGPVQNTSPPSDTSSSGEGRQSLRPVSETQGGWAMLESALALALFASILAIVSTLVERVGREISSSATVSDVARGDIGLTGYLLANQRLPSPDSMKINPLRPNYVEGWLPKSTLGLDPRAEQVRYLVHKSLVDPVPIYNADPLNVTQNKIPLRTVTSVADTCFQLFQLEKGGASLPGGIRAAYVLQQMRSPTGELLLPDDIWPGDTAQSALPPGSVNLTTTALGFNEIAGQLGCFSYMPKLMNSVKAAGVAVDMEYLATIDYLFRDLEVDIIKDKIDNLKWKEIDWGILMSAYTLRAIRGTLNWNLTPGGMASLGVYLGAASVTIGAASAVLALTVQELNHAENVELPAKLAAKNKSEIRLILMVIETISRVNDAILIQSAKEAQ